MYRNSVTLVESWGLPGRRRQRGRLEKTTIFLPQLARNLFLMGYFTVLPVLLTIGLNWLVYPFTVNTFYREEWMMPTLILLAAFLAGVLMRRRMEAETGGMGLFALGCLALITFAVMSHQDILTTGGVYSHWMPELLRAGVLHYTYFLPTAGLLGMLFHRYCPLGR